MYVTLLGVPLLLRGVMFKPGFPFWFPTAPHYIPIEGFQRIFIFFGRLPRSSLLYLSRVIVVEKIFM